ncbi:MAG: cbb3-type cytochrome oxidase assembly protein CcoS [Deltaproteobacteria bacterium]|nr:cbb3-type cytochrome oxidase assembly protein CcoS [Deltaproteobacteria bacterium]
MYLGHWLVLVLLSLAASVLAFLWGLGTGQFSDPERARYLALTGEPARPAGDAVRPCRGAYALVVILCLSVLVLFAPVALTLWRLRG